MAGPVNTPYSSRKKAFAINTQTAPGTPIALTSADCLDVSSCSWSPQSRTQADNRYTGTVHRPGPAVLGASYDIQFEWPIHGWSGALPAANAFIAGRILAAWGFTENRVATAIGPEAYSAPGVTGATLGATAVGTADLYKGYAINLAVIGAAPLGLAMIKDYTSGKVATFARSRTLGAGNYTIPTQLAYTLSSTEAANPSSISVWEGNTASSGDRWNFTECRPTAATIQLSTSSRDGGGDGFGKITGTFTGVLSSTAVEVAPTVPIAVAIPPFLNGQQDIALQQLGGASLSIDLGIKSAFPPNPNQLTGDDPGLVVETLRTVTMELNKVNRAVIDFEALAAAQSNTHPLQALWGLSSGNYMGLMCDAMRFDYPTTNEGTDFISTTGQAYVDGVNRALALSFVGY